MSLHRPYAIEKHLNYYIYTPPPLFIFIRRIYHTSRTSARGAWFNRHFVVCIYIHRARAVRLRKNSADLCARARVEKKKNKNKRRDAAQLGAYMEICEAYVWISDKATLCGASDVSANSRAGLKASERRPFVKSASERKCAKFFLTSEWFLMCVYAWRQLSMMNGGPKLKAYLIN